MKTITPLATSRSILIVPLKFQQGDVERRFEALAHRWIEEAGGLSVVADMVAHPAYRNIVDMGDAVVPFILRAIRREPTFLYRALRDITGQNPAPPGSDPDETDEAWLAWGRDKGYLE